MILNLTKSKLFKKHPDTRFSEEYTVPKGAWNEIWRRYKLLDYSPADIKDFVFVKYARSLSYPTISRWIFRTEIYSISAPLIKKGVVHANSEIFKEFEEELMNELLKTMQYDDTNSSRTII